MNIHKGVIRYGSRFTALVLSFSLLINPAFASAFSEPVRAIHPLSTAELFASEALVQRLLHFFRPKSRPNQAREGLQLLQQEAHLARGNQDTGVTSLEEPQAVESLKEIVGAFGSQTEEEYARSLERTKSLVGMLGGVGLNEVDKHLMTLFYQAPSSQVKHRLLAAREFMFERSGLLAERGMAETGAVTRHPEETQTAAEAAARLRSNLERWRQWALAYAAAYLRDHPSADTDNVKITGKSIADEIEQDIYQPLLKAVTEIERLARQGQIDPDGVSLKLSRTASDAKVSIEGRSARVGFLPMKGDPWQVGHIFLMLEAIAENRLDKLVIMVDNSDPERKPNLSSLTVREPITLELLKVLEPFVEYTPISKEEEDLRTADGERSIFRLMQFNRHTLMNWFYMVGSDHRRWEIQRGEKTAPDTAKKLHDHRQMGTDGYSNEELGIIFIERKGEEFQEGEMDSLRSKSGIEAISSIRQPMDTSSTRVRKDKHWWTVPYDVFAMAESFRFWGAEEASRVAKLRNPQVRTMGGSEVGQLSSDTDTGLRIRGGRLRGKAIFDRQRLIELLELALKRYSENKSFLWRFRDWIKSPFGVAVHVFPTEHDVDPGIAFMRPGLWPAFALSQALLDGLQYAVVNAEELGLSTELVARVVHHIVQHELDHSRMWRLPRWVHLWVPFSWNHDLQNEMARIRKDLDEVHNYISHEGLLDRNPYNREQNSQVEKLLGLPGLESYGVYVKELDRISQLPTDKRETAIWELAAKTLEARGIRTMGGGVASPLAQSYPERAHPILQRVKEVGPIEVLEKGKRTPKKEQNIVQTYLAQLIHGHSLAAFDAWRYHAVGHNVGKFGDKVATDAFTRWYNSLPFVLTTQAAEGARDVAATVAGRYGLPGLLGLNVPPEIAYANDPVEVTERLQRRKYLANTSIAAYALGKLYELHRKSLPTLKLPDQVYMLGVAGPKGSGVQVNLDPSNWVEENMRRAGNVRSRAPPSVRVTGVLIRERHLQLINDALRVLKIRLSDIPAELHTYFRQESNEGPSLLPPDQITSFKDYVKNFMGGMVTFRTSAGGSITMITDGDLMPILDIGQDKADIAFGAGGVAESMIKTRAAYQDIDYQGRIISYLATEDGKKDALQVLDPEAQILRNGPDKKGKTVNEIELATKAGLPVENARVNQIYGLDDLDGGPYNLTIIASPLGDPETHESNFVHGLREVEVLNGGEEVRVTLLVIEPSGKKSLIPIIYETGLRDLELKYASEKFREHKAATLIKMGRLYGDLRMYQEAEDAFEKAIRLVPEQEKDVMGVQAYYRGMRELLEKDKPNVDIARKHFEEAKELGYVHGQMMLEVIEFGKPKTVEPAKIVDAIDNLVKQTEEGRGDAMAILVNRIREADQEHYSTIALLVNKLADYQKTSSENGRVKELIDRIIDAIAKNPALGPDLAKKLSRQNGQHYSPAGNAGGQRDAHPLRSAA